MQPNALDCGFHVVLNARSLTKYMLDRDEDAPVANLKDDWQLAATIISPTGGPPIPQAASAAHHGIAIRCRKCLPSFHRALLQQLVQRAYVHNNRNNPITKKTTASGSLFFSLKNWANVFASLRSTHNIAPPREGWGFRGPCVSIKG